MKLFREYKSLDLNKTAETILNFWQDNDIFAKSISTREGKEDYVFFEGPPSANGMPGIHHVMARTIKDIFCRYQTLKGKRVLRKAGWDTHGLPVELSVEKELNITKEDIGKKISIEEYNNACKQAVMRYTDVWNELTQKIGYWVDLENPYITYKPKYMESVWWLLKQLYSKDKLYKGYTIQPYSPKAGTGLSSHEVNQPGMYRDVTDTTIVAQFKVNKNPSDSHKVWKEILDKTKTSNSEVSTEGCGGAFHWNDIDDNEVYFLAWTTTPWTLPSNTALTVGKKIDYVLVKTFNQYTFKPVYVILAKNLVAKQFGKKYFESNEDADFNSYTEDNKKIPYQIISEYKGSDLVGIKYEQLLPWILPYENAENAFQVIDGDFVTTEDGTGIVHTAPTFGADDAKVAKEHNVPAMLILDKNENPVPLVDLQGRFIKQINNEFAGKYVKNEYYDENSAPEKSVDVEIAILLKTENKAFKVEKYVHSYPHCWRTDKPILYYPLDSWFVKVTDDKQKLIDLNKTINWKPKSTGEGRFGNWLENANDWNLSRSRYWGIPLPIWRTEDKTEEICIGSVEELISEIEKSIQAGLMKENPFKSFELGNLSDENYEKIDLHKNIVDAIILVSDSGKPMKRESDLIDVWFDSGAMPFAQNHFPFGVENKEEYLKNKAQADFIAEGVDQTRGWFYTLHTISSLIFNQVAYKNVVSNGLVLDKNGQKMSKRLGNAVDPFETLQKYGPDATRWYMISNAQPWENLKFDLDGIDEVRRKFFGTLYNTYSFFALYANADSFTYSEDDIPFDNRPELDRWILSELNLLIKQVNEFYSDYEPTRATRLISEFVLDNLSNWFVRLSRRRFWKGDYSDDKISAYQTLYKCLNSVAILASPVAPFFSDRLFKDLNEVTNKYDVESVHLADFPVSNENEIDENLITRARLTQDITSMVFSLRKKENLKVRQPLSKIIIPVDNSDVEQHIKLASDLIKQEVNVKEVDFITSEKASEILVKSVKPNFKVLGPKLGKDIKTVSQKLQNLTKEEIQNFESSGSITVDNHKISLEEVEILTKDLPGWTVASNGKLTVALDISLDDELINEGISREFVNRIQNIRKEKEFELNDRITIEIKNNSFNEAILSNKQYIMEETLADNIILSENLDESFTIEINEQIIPIKINKN
ncbi:MAG: isoleucine--tRNA ligase [Flavobacteriales bacterium]|nr:isoleucine--tRNA ligase [Flavobacteriales bacterium]